MGRRSVTTARQAVSGSPVVAFPGERRPLHLLAGAPHQDATEPAPYRATVPPLHIVGIFHGINPWRRPPNIPTWSVAERFSWRFMAAAVGFILSWGRQPQQLNFPTLRRRVISALNPREWGKCTFVRPRIAGCSHPSTMHIRVKILSNFPTGPASHHLACDGSVNNGSVLAAARRNRNWILFGKSPIGQRTFRPSLQTFFRECDERAMTPTVQSARPRRPSTEPRQVPTVGFPAL